jgi:hypothetical protein
MTPKRPRESEWIVLRTTLDQDFEGLTLSEIMPRLAHAYLVRENLTLDMRGSMGKTCTSAFNDLEHSIESYACDDSVYDWYQLSIPGYDSEWRNVLQEAKVDIATVLGEHNPKTKRCKGAFQVIPFDHKRQWWMFSYTEDVGVTPRMVLLDPASVTAADRTQIIKSFQEAPRSVRDVDDAANGDDPSDYLQELGGVWAAAPSSSDLEKGCLQIMGYSMLFDSL